jgi:hypothetical protein
MHDAVACDAAIAGRTVRQLAVTDSGNSERESERLHLGLPNRTRTFRKGRVGVLEGQNLLPIAGPGGSHETRPY